MRHAWKLLFELEGGGRGAGGARLATYLPPIFPGKSGGDKTDTKLSGHTCLNWGAGLPDWARFGSVVDDVCGGLQVILFARFSFLG